MDSAVGGTVSIGAPMTLNPTGGASTDGVRVAIQRERAEPAGNLVTTSSQAFTIAITTTVVAGDDVYFRVGSVNEGDTFGASRLVAAALLTRCSSAMSVVPICWLRSE
jgi:hypothetical protein